MRVKRSLALVLVFSLLILAFATFNIPTAKSSPDYGFKEQTYYLREALPTHGQEWGSSDTGHLNHTGPTTDEERHCSVWVQYYLDEDDPLKEWVIFEIHWHIYWASIMSGDVYAGYQCNGTHSNSMDKKKKIGGYNPTYDLYNETWTDVLIKPPNVANSYFFTLKVQGNSIYVMSNSTWVSYVTIKYGCRYTFHGLLDENSGLLNSPGERAVNVTAYYLDETSETFEVNGTYIYNTSFVALYFLFDLGSNDREYWISSAEYEKTIYVFNQTLTTYTINFVDLAGALDDYPYVEAQRLINGSLMTVEKRKVDAEKKLQFSLIRGCKYTIEIKDGASYTFGDLLFTTTTSITLTLRGIEFPQNIILGYRYVRTYAYRHNNQSSISVCYEDTQGNPADVDVDIQFKNGTSVSGSYPYTYSDTNYFNHTWSNGLYDTTYLVVVDVSHSKYGEMPYRTVLAGAGSGQPWVLPIGTIPGINTGDLIPTLLIFGCFAVFSQVNAYLGAFVGTILAIILTWLGWVSIPSSMLVTALTFTLLLGIKYMKKKAYE